MTALEPVGFSVMAILVMALVTLLTRAGGFYLMARVTMTARIRRMLEALPGSIVAAIVLPIVVMTGPTAMLALAAAVAIMTACRNELLAMAAGMAVAALARAAGI
jgi:uncharacterized membrane protein